MNEKPDITIVKTDNAEAPKTLGDAAFRLYRRNDRNIYDLMGNGEVFTIPDTGYTYTGLEEGAYMLEEMTPPPGYVFTTKNTYFTLDSSQPGAILLAQGTENASVDSEHKDIIYIQNAPGAELPMTGGPGTRGITLLGILFISFAGTGMAVMRKKERNTA